MTITVRPATERDLSALAGLYAEPACAPTAPNSSVSWRSTRTAIGSATSAAEDAVQDAWLRFSRCGASGVRNLGGWLTTMVARSCLDILRSRTSRREEPLEAHLPEPIVSHTDTIDPEHEALLADSVGLALLVVLYTLAPAERLAFVLHDMFDVPFDQIAPIVSRSPAAARSSPAARAAGCSARARHRTPI